MSSRKERVLIITHWDGDGLTSAAIVLKKYPDAELVIARPHNLPDKLSKTLKNPPDRIYILDVSPSYPKARELIKKLAKKTKIDIIDHHPNYPRSPSRLFTWSSSKSVSQLTSEKVLQDRYLAELGAQCDYLIDLPEYREEAELFTFALRYKIADDDFKIRVARLLARGLRISQIPDVIKEGHEGKKKFEQVLKTAKKVGVQVTPTFFATYLKKTHGFGGLVAEKLSRRDKVAMVMSRAWDEKGKVVFAIRRWDVPVNLGKVVGEVCRELGGGGGGHPYAAGGSVPNKRREEFIRLIAEHIEGGLKER